MSLVSGIYTVQHGWTQTSMPVIGKVHQHWPIEFIRSGGQTGATLAGWLGCALGTTVSPAS